MQHGRGLPLINQTKGEAMASPEQVGHGWMHAQVFRLKKDCPTAREYLGYWENGEPAMKPTPYKAGDLVKVVMVSRFGDCGITTDLKAEYGYAARVMPEELEQVTSDKR